ncbi:MAG: hypothetical protein HOA72_19105 [Desulfobacula sp.]|uniref:hypothetical protein n=1 Tax=Desulfobacula sp. TaxID=2593537 RepID=UPI002A0954B3|nr:hypothetical protein [Desulfobacula sp.]
MVKELFGSVDINGDNSIDLKEFKYALRDIENINCEELFKNAEKYIGKLLTVQFLGLTDDGKPKIAKGKDIREGY